ncbi:SRPBCC domain-containing protein [Haliscomenobacter sp.]|uniref:SRPBCC family protein n=1 Tax=Haliscomenobacter sp. TaxID=2717303 RepID=UPI003593E789
MTPSQIPDAIHKTITIKAPAALVWHHLTTPDLMKQWMLDQDMEILSDWKAESPLS